MVKSRKWMKVAEYVGMPTDANFKLEEEELPAPKDGEFICEAVYYSIDPFMRCHEYPVGIVVIGEQVAKVIESRSEEFPVGCLVQVHAGWRDTTLVNVDEMREELKLIRVPDLGDNCPSLALGVLGMPGMTAYYGFQEVCQPKEGDVVLVNGAAGAVGSIVGQIAKIRGCKVIAFCGTKEKCDWLKSLGFDHVFNYKEVDVDKALKEAVPDGIDCYFDNVGGEFSSKALLHMKRFGKVSVCGAISTYNDVQPIKLPFPFITILFRQLKVEGFIVYQWTDRFPQGKAQMLQWISQGKIKYKETFREGFENMPKTLIEVLNGANIGKMIIKA